MIRIIAAGAFISFMAWILWSLASLPDPKEKKRKQIRKDKVTNGDSNEDSKS